MEWLSSAPEPLQCGIALLLSDGKKMRHQRHHRPLHGSESDYVPLDKASILLLRQQGIEWLVDGSQGQDTASTLDIDEMIVSNGPHRLQLTVTH